MAILVSNGTPSGSPAPFVDIVVDDLPPGTERLTVWRTVKGRRFAVRGMYDVLAAGGAAARDYEAPFGVQSSYQVEYLATGGMPIGFSDPATTILPNIESGWAWWHNPLDPSSAVKVRLLGTTAQEIVRETPGASLQIPGRSVGLTLPGTRSGVKGVVLDCVTLSREESDRFDALFGGYDDEGALSIVCVRTNPETWLPPTLFAFVGSPTLRPKGADWAEWGITGDETTPPTPAVITPLLTYQDFTDFYPTYAAFTAAYPDYLTASRDYSIGE